MSRLLGLILVLSLMAGCVTEKRVNGVDVTEPTGSNVEAAKTRLALAVRYIEQGNPEAARRNLDQAESLAPNLAEVYLTQAFFYQTVSQDGRAVKAYQKALKLDPGNSDVLNNFGVLRCDMGQFDDAILLFERALQDPRYVKVADTNENAGLCAYRANDLEAAEAYFLAALNYNPRRSRSLLGLADIYIDEHEFKMARSYLKQFERTSDPTSQSMFAWIRLENKLGNFSEEAERGRDLATNFPDSPETKKYFANEY